jgi:hypothetical protein
VNTSVVGHQEGFDAALTIQLSSQLLCLSLPRPPQHRRPITSRAVRRELTFHELATVAAGGDNDTWSEFPGGALGTDSDFGGCAAACEHRDESPAVARILLASGSGIGGLRLNVSGCDQYDLADLGIAGTRYVRITDRVDLLCGQNDVFDLGAVAIVNAACP